MAQIRELAEDDAEILWRLRLTALETEPKAFRESATEHRSLSVEAFAKRLGNEENFVFGAFDGANLVGMTGFYREERLKRRHKGWIWGVFVLPAHRGKGIGRALLSAALERARALHGLTHIHLTVGATQREAQALYESLGFRVFGVEPEALRVEGEAEDEVQMYWRVGESASPAC